MLEKNQNDSSHSSPSKNDKSGEQSDEQMRQHSTNGVSPMKEERDDQGNIMIDQKDRELYFH